MRNTEDLNEMLTHIDLFSGIGGFALAARWAGFRTICFSEIDPYASAVLRKHWPDVPNLGDITKANFEPYAGATVLTGGWPCQPWSRSGLHRGTSDDRHLWPAMLTAIQSARPAWVVGENVDGIIGVDFSDMLSSLEHEGYSVQPLLIPALCVGAPIERNRVFTVACSNQEHGKARMGNRKKAPLQPWPRTKSEAVWMEAVREAARMDDGIPTGLYRRRVEGIGNSIVPQVAFEILKAIARIECA